ncbi:MAG: Slp family lipoprotein [Rudaea sp.]
MRYLVSIISLSALLLGGCATVPTPIAGKDFAAITPKQVTTQDAHGTRVRWGGEIIKVEPKAEQTCFEVLSRALYPDARPNRRDDSDGRFIACGHGFYDPEVYKKGRDLTVTGQIAGTEQHLVGEHEYTYARVDADGVYLWPKREAQPLYDPWGSYFYDPFWGPFGGPYWFTPPVVIIRGPPPHS